MPLKQSNVTTSDLARSGATLTGEAAPKGSALEARHIKQASRHFSIRFPAFVLLLSACGAQATPLPQIPRESLPVNSSVQIVTFTPAPYDVFLGDSVPSALRTQVEGLNVRLGVSRFPVQEPQSDEIQIQWYMRSLRHSQP